MQKKNLYYIITYFILVLFFFMGTLFYRQSFLAVLLLLECLLPALSLGATYFVSRRLELSVTCTVSQLTAGNSIPVTISIHNPTFFPLLNLEAEFESDNLFYRGEHLKHTICLSAQPRKTTDYTLSFDTCYSGMFSFRICKVTVTDLLHMKSFVLPFHQQIELPIFPEPISLPPVSLPLSNEAAEDSDIPLKYGVVTTEFQGVRDYIPGDRLQNIHWKMSAKADDLLVRNPQPVAERLLTIIPELERSQLEDTLISFFSFARQLVRAQETFLVGIFSYAEKTFQFFQVKNMEQLTEAILQLYYAKVYTGSALARTSYAGQNPEAEFLSIYGKKIDYCTGEEVQP